MELRFCIGKDAGYFNEANQRYSVFFLFSFRKIALKLGKKVMLRYL